MKCLVLFHSKHGQTEKIARRIGEVMESKQVDVDVRPITAFDASFSVSSYDVVVIGAPIYTARYHRQVSRFVVDSLGNLNKTVTAFFSVSLSSYGNQSQKLDAVRCFDEFLKKTGLSPMLEQHFAGALAYRKYDWFTRWMMKRIVGKSGGETDTSKNYEYTDWEQVDQFAIDVWELASRNTEQSSTAKPSTKELESKRWRGMPSQRNR